MNSLINFLFIFIVIVRQISSRAYNETTAPTSLKCYCNNDKGEQPCNDYGETLMCEFAYTTRKNMNDDGDDVVEHATCVALRHPKRGIYYSCKWSEMVGTTRSCGVRTGSDGLNIDFCECNNENFCNENFFEDEIDTHDVGDDQTVDSITTSPTPIVVEKIIKELPTPSTQLANFVQRSTSFSTNSPINTYLNNGLIELSSFSTSPPSITTRSTGSSSMMLSPKIEPGSKKCYDCDSPSEKTSTNDAISVSKARLRLAAAFVVLKIVWLTIC